MATQNMKGFQGAAKKMLAMFAWWLCLLFCGPVYAQLQETEILQSAADRDCLEYRVVGVCLWLNCGLQGCSLQTSPRISHYLPDAVVSAWSGRPPWAYSGRLNQLAATTGGGLSAAGRQASTLRFMNAELIGSPALAMGLAASANSWLCPSAARPMAVYFLSNADPLGWRKGLPSDMLAALGGGRNIGSGVDIWGPLQPRHGFVLQADVHRGAAVIAQRAADISTDPDTVHVRNRLGDECGRGCDGPGPVRENDRAGGKWQPLFPQRGACRVFGAAGASAPYGEEQRYAWHLWRPYQCCRPRGQQLLRVIPLAR